MHNRGSNVWASRFLWEWVSSSNIIRESQRVTLSLHLPNILLYCNTSTANGLSKYLQWALPSFWDTKAFLVFFVLNFLPDITVTELTRPAVLSRSGHLSASGTQTQDGRIGRTKAFLCLAQGLGSPRVVASFSLSFYNGSGSWAQAQTRYSSTFNRWGDQLQAWQSIQFGFFHSHDLLRFNSFLKVTIFYQMSLDLTSSSLWQDISLLPLGLGPGTLRRQRPREDHHKK